MPEVAPMHVSSTIYLTRLGFYDGVIFHRIIPNFMAQGGDPTGTGRGGPGYSYGGEVDSKARHDRGGLLSMANAGPGTDGSQFFLTFVATPWLDGKHTLFGEVVEGKETLERMEKLGTRGSGRPRARVEIKTARVSVE
jgi:cyclophilin family peptidyl-prolyl cis-trans isomerase